MERPFSGLTARILVNNNVIGYLDSVELNLEKDVAEVLQFGAQYREKLPTIKNWTASTDGTCAFAAGESQHKLYQAYESGEYITLQVRLAEGVYFEGSALVSSLSISGSPDDKMSLSAEFEGSGGITFTLPETFIIAISSAVGGTTNPAGNVRVVKNDNLTITCIPATGKTADKYYLDSDTTGVAITENTFTLSSVVADHTVYVTFKAAE